MRITVDYKSFITEFINKTLDVCTGKDSKIGIFVEGDYLYSVTTFSNGSVFLYNKFKLIDIENPIERFNINLNKFKQGLICIKNNPIINIEFLGNTCVYQDDNIKINFKLLNNDVVSVPKFNKHILDNLEIEHEFSLNEEVLKDIQNALSFTQETGKFYIEKENNKLYFFFGDKQENSENSLRVLIREDYDKDFGDEEYIFDVAILKFILKSSSSDIIFSIPTSGRVLVVTTKNDSAQQQYISPKLRK